MSHAGAIGDAFILMQDNARAHTAQVSMTFIDDTDISVVNWPARSPYITPTEHTWSILSRRIRQRPHHPANVRHPGSGIADHITKGHQEYTKSLSGVCER